MAQCAARAGLHAIPCEAAKMKKIEMLDILPQGGGGGPCAEGPWIRRDGQGQQSPGPVQTAPPHQLCRKARKNMAWNVYLPQV